MTLDITTTNTIEEVDQNQWNHVVEQSKVGSVFHRYEWLRAVESGTSYEPRHLLVSKKGNPIAVFPNFLVGGQRIPFSHLVSTKFGSGGPVVTAEEEKAVRLLLDEIHEICNKTVLSSQILTRGENHIRYHELFKEKGYEQKLSYCDFELDLTQDWDEILSDMDSSRRRAIRQGHENDFEIVDKEITKQTMSEFYDGFASVMERVGEYRRPRSFFLELAEFAERVKVLSLYLDGKERGAILLVLDDEQSRLFYEESAIEEEHFEYNSSELLHEHAIRWGQENGYETYNFGGTDVDFRDGLFRFKEKFGAQPVPSLIWERGISTPLWPAYRVGRYFYRQL